MSGSAGVLGQPGLLIPYALVQLTVILLVLRSLDLFERKPVGLVALMALAGATIAPAVALALRPLVGRWTGTGAAIGTDGLWRRALLPALTEEPAKALCVLLLFAVSVLLSGRLRELEFDGVNDGMVYGAAVGLGFAFTENLFYLIGQGDLPAGLSVFSVRTDFFGVRILSHAVYTAYFGAGLGLATWQRRGAARVVAPLVGLAVGVGTHAVHDRLVLAGSTRTLALVDYAFLIGALAAMAGWLARERRAVLRTLAVERADGLPLTDADVALAADVTTAVRRQAAAFRAGDAVELQRLRRLRSALVRLAFSTWRARARGWAVVTADAHRAEVRALLATPVVAARVPLAALQAWAGAAAPAQGGEHSSGGVS